MSKTLYPENQKKKRLFEIGANTGEKTVALRERYQRVVCFEPNPELARGLLEKFKDSSDVIIEEVGLAESSGVKRLILSNSHLLSTFSKE